MMLEDLRQDLRMLETCRNFRNAPEVAGQALVALDMLLTKCDVLEKKLKKAERELMESEQARAELGKRLALQLQETAAEGKEGKEGK